MTERRGGPAPSPLPGWLLGAVGDFLDDIRDGKYNGGGQLVVNVNRDGCVTSVEPKGRIEPRGRRQS
jgi:hypothetical protein